MWKNVRNLAPKHRLDAGKIIETAKNLAEDINVRLPGTNLAALAQELVNLAVATEERARRARRPFLAIRAISALAISLVLVALWYLGRHIHAKWEFATINNVFDALNTGFNLLLLLAGALWFCVTIEARIKRREALGFIEELREFAHVIDLTQLYYTPDLYRYRRGAKPGNPAIDETYLLFSTQMLAVIGNLAPLYTRGTTGDSILRAASEVEMLAIAISTKHLAKAEAVLAAEQAHLAGGRGTGRMTRFECSVETRAALFRAIRTVMRAPVTIRRAGHPNPVAAYTSQGFRPDCAATVIQGGPSKAPRRCAIRIMQIEQLR